MSSFYSLSLNYSHLHYSWCTGTQKMQILLLSPPISIVQTHGGIELLEELPTYGVRPKTIKDGYLYCYLIQIDE